MQLLKMNTQASAFSQSWLVLLLYLVLSAPFSSAISLNVTDKESIKTAARITAEGLISWYTGNEPGQIPGILPSPEYYWWEGGAMWMSLVDYWWYTGDSQFNHLITQGIQFQRGEGNNFMVTNWSAQTGNDDQAFWGFAAMDAAELKFPNPPKSFPSWLALAQAVFNTQTTRFTHECGGGLPWQVYITSPGYTYKNTISNGCFFSLAARLARYTGNDTYAEWGMKAWEWTRSIGLMTPEFAFYDGTSILNNCSTINGIQYTYNAGVFLHGAATMWNYTKLPIWRDRVNGIIDGLYLFFDREVMYEQYCEPTEKCNVDQRSFKAYLARWMAVCAQLAPFSYYRLMPLLQRSAQAAAKACIGGDDGTSCGLRWVINGTTGHFDGSVGPGEQMAAMSVIGSLMIQFTDAVPVTHVDGISASNPAAGLANPLGSTVASLMQPDPPSMADKAGAWIITALLAVTILGGAVWAMWPEKDAHLKFVGGGHYILNERAATEQLQLQEKKEQMAVSLSKRASGVGTAREGSIRISSPTHLSPQISSPAHLSSPQISSPTLIQTPPRVLSMRAASPIE